jgi:hypothetical protein
MKIQRLRSTALVLLVSILGVAVGTARADITIERTTSVDGVGAMAFANMSGTSKTSISGDKSRTDSDMKMQSKIIGFLARNAVGPSAEIVLLDQDKLYHLNMNKKEYTETTFEHLRADAEYVGSDEFKWGQEAALRGKRSQSHGSSLECMKSSRFSPELARNLNPSFARTGHRLAAGRIRLQRVDSGNWRE